MDGGCASNFAWLGRRTATEIAEMITPQEERETRDAGRKNPAEKHYPEERRASQLAALQESDPTAPRPARARATTGKRDRQCPAHRCVGGRTPRHQQNTRAQRSLIELVRAVQFGAEKLCPANSLPYRIMVPVLDGMRYQFVA